MPEAALDNWQPVWNAQVSISTPVCAKSPDCYLGAVEHAKKFPPHPWHTASLVLSR